MSFCRGYIYDSVMVESAMAVLPAMGHQWKLSGEKHVRMWLWLQQ
ncbi:hypothetical protein [Desulfomarina sp.]